MNASSAASKAPTAPVVEHRADALGIGWSRPRLSWRLPTGFGPQHSYEIQVAHAAGSPVVEWVGSAEQILVPWVGPDLGSRDRCEVRVRVLGAGRVLSAWSPPTSVEAGLLRDEDWVAQRITSSEVLDRPVLLRRSFRIDGPVQAARLYISYRGVGEPRLNGAVVSDEVLAPGWQSYRHRELYSTLDVTEYLVQGDNQLEVLLGDGWYRGRLGFLQQRALYGDQVSLLAQLEIEQGGERRVAVAGDEHWEWSTDATLAADLYDGETYDARDEHATAARWRPVEVLRGPVRAPEAPVGPPVRRTGTIPAQRILTSPSGRALVDFGQNLVGRVRLRVHGPAGTTVVLRHAEVLEDGELAVRPLRSAAATDRYTLRGDGCEEWEPRFTYHGFRYVEVSGWPGGAPTTADLEAVVLHSDMTRTGWFSSSSADLNQLHANVVWSMRGNFVSIPTDCPQRDERLGWTGDISVFGPTATYLFDCVGMLSSWLRDLALEQQADGMVPFFVPDVPFPHEVKDVPGLAPSHTAVWGDAAVLVPFALYRASGDTGVLEQQYDSMQRWVDGVAQLVGERLVWDEGFQFGDWLDPVAPPEDPAAGATETALVATAYFANSTRLLALAGALTGREQDQARYEALGAQVAEAFRRRFLRPGHRLTSDTQTAYAIAICLDLLPDADQRARAGERLAELVRTANHRIATGFVGTALVLDALSATGWLEDAMALLLQTECPSWLYPVRMGATTVWERWDSMLSDGSINPGEMTSFNHYALGAVADWLHRVVGGLSSDVPGWSRIRIAPRPSAPITAASTAHLTPYGLAEVRWQVKDARLVIEATIPEGTTGLVDLPGETSWGLEAGVHRIDRPWPAAVAAPTTASFSTPRP